MRSWRRPKPRTNSPTRDLLIAFLPDTITTAIVTKTPGVLVRLSACSLGRDDEAGQVRSVCSGVRAAVEQDVLPDEIRCVRAAHERAHGADLGAFTETSRWDARLRGLDRLGERLVAGLGAAFHGLFQPAGIAPSRQQIVCGDVVARDLSPRPPPPP